MSQPVAPGPHDVQAFPQPQGHDLPDRIFEHDQVVTGEAVALDIQPAGPILLIAGAVIDMVITYTVFIAAVTFLSAYGWLNASAAQTYTIVALVLAVAVIPAIVETVTGGRSMGKWIMGVQIVRDDGGAIRFRHAVIRSLVSILEIYLTLGSIALLSTLVNSRHKRLGDLLAGTYPIAVRASASLPPPLMMPPDLVPWAGQADVSRLPGRIAWQVRQFLNTGGQLDPNHRARIAQQLLTSILPHVSPAPPAQTHPERVLAAVLVIRRDAEYLHGQRLRSSLEARTERSLPYGLPGN